MVNELNTSSNHIAFICTQMANIYNSQPFHNHRYALSFFSALQLFLLSILLFTRISESTEWITHLACLRLIVLIPRLYPCCYQQFIVIKIELHSMQMNCINCKNKITMLRRSIYFIVLPVTLRFYLMISILISAFFLPDRVYKSQRFVKLMEYGCTSTKSE